MTDFRNPRKLSNLLVGRYGTHKRGLSIYGICKKCKKNVIVPLGMSSEKFSNIKDFPKEVFDIAAILKHVECTKCKGMLDENSIDKIGVYKCSYLVKRGMREQREDINSSKEFADQYTILSLRALEYHNRSFMYIKLT